MKRTLRFGLVGVSLFAAACEPESPAASEPVSATLHLQAVAPAPTVTTIVVRVAAADIYPPLVWNFDVAEGVASGTLNVPAGSARAIQVSAFDAVGVETHRADTTMTIMAEANPPLQLSLNPLLGDMPVTVSVGELIVAVSPALARLTTGETVALSATVRSGPTTDVTDGREPTWATTHPEVATVSTGGLVTAMGPGSVNIVAVFDGLAGTAVLEVVDPPTIKGSVKTTTGDAVPGASIAASSATLERTTFSDVKGRFSLSPLPDGSYTVRFVAPSGYTPVPPDFPHRADGTAIVIEKVDADPTQPDIEFVATPRTEASIAPRKAATLASEGGLRMRVEAGAVPLRASVVRGSPGDLAAVGVEDAVAISVRPDVETAAALRSAPAGLGAGSLMGATITVERAVGALVSGITWIIDLGADAAPTLLFADREATTVVDPATGEERRVSFASFPADAFGDQFTATLGTVTPTACLDDIRTLTPVRGGRTDGIPLILIHGWQFLKWECGAFREFDPARETFQRLLASLRADTGVTNHYTFYTLRYPSFESIALTSEFLQDRIVEDGLAAPVLVGHSMGGLVGRALAAAHGSDHLRGLITLGTPHTGSPLVRYLRDASLLRTISSPDCGPLERFAEVGFTLLPFTDGVSDLDADGGFIAALGAAAMNPEKLFTFAGELDHISEFDLRPVRRILGVLRCLMDAATPGTASDGVVPVESAAIPESALQVVIPGYDHLEMASGEIFRREVLFKKVREVLHTLSRCETGPAPPTRNEFALSGALARRGDHEVDVTLNPVIVDGVVKRGLASSDFAVIENGCIRPHDVTTAEGTVGIDLVFVQDMSGSMSRAISGVRTSVIELASDLAARGLDVRIGSVGYSGPGGVPSTPSTSAAEDLGPIQTLTDPTTFQEHVSSSWIATGGADGPENGLEAIEYAHRNFAWRGGAARVYIDITDAPHHTAASSCNGAGACTDQTLETIVELLGGTSAIHVVTKPSFAETGGQLDPNRLADATGGRRLDLGGGVVDLGTLAVADIIGETVRITFQSMSSMSAVHSLRIRAAIDGKVAELRPGLLFYTPPHPSLRR